MKPYMKHSFWRRWAKVQSNVEKQMPQAANWPPSIGARSFTRAIPASARRLKPFGAFLDSDALYMVLSADGIYVKKIHDLLQYFYQQNFSGSLAVLALNIRVSRFSFTHLRGPLTHNFLVYNLHCGSIQKSKPYNLNCRCIQKLSKL